MAEGLYEKLTLMFLGRIDWCIGDRKEGWSRGPRSLFLRRCDNGFGFTLRHFIVYPPESYTVLQGDHRLGLHHGHQGTALDEPMDTIFVKNVREHSPAYEAGLATGDRIISVNGQTITGHSYAQVVQLIQQSGSFLHLLVVPKEDDILQLYFGETAHNPETNQRPSRVKSPEVTECRFAAGSMLQQGSHHHHHRRHSSSQQRSLQPSTENSPEVWSSPSPPEGLVIGSENRGTSACHIGLDPTWYRSRYNKAAPGRRSSEGVTLTRREAVYGYVPVTISDLQTARSNHYSAPVSDRRFSSGNTLRIPGSSVSSVFKPLQILDERRLVSSDVAESSGSASLYSTVKSDNSRSLLPLQRQQFVVTPTPSSDSMASSRYGSSENVHSSSNSLQGLCYPSSAGCRLSLDGGRRESSVSLPSSSVHDNFTSDGSKDSLLSCDSTSTLTGGQDGCSSDDSVIISRIRKSFEQKEEFLKRPNQPISWNLPENENNEHLQQIVPQSTASQAIIAREFYARPQKFQRPVWPPQSPSTSPSPSSYRQQSPSRTSISGKSNHSVAANNRPTHQNLRRVKSDIDSERDSVASRGSDARSAARFERASSEPCEDYSKSRGQFICGGPVTNVPPPSICKGVYSQDSTASQFRPIMPVAGTTTGTNHRHTSGKTAFVTTLARIHENIPALDSVNNFTSVNYPSSKLNDEYDELYKNGGNSSLPPSLHSSPIADSQQFSCSLSPTEENNGNISRYPQHQMLQLVSRRARQFETGVLEDDQSPSDRTSLYRSELWWLSSKKSVPNVAVRKREFESRAGSLSGSTVRESRRPNRESRSLESAVMQGKTTQPSSNLPAVSGNQMIPIGGRQLHCEPPHHFQQFSTVAGTAKVWGLRGGRKLAMCTYLAQELSGLQELLMCTYIKTTVLSVYEETLFTSATGNFQLSQLQCEKTEPPPSAQDEPSSGPVKLRARSNSAESWAAATIARSRNVLEWPPPRAQDPEPQRHKAVRQDSYLAAVRTPVSSERPSKLKRQSALSVDEDFNEMEEPAVAASAPLLTVQAPSPPYPAVRPTQLPIPYPLRPAEPTCEPCADSAGEYGSERHNLGRHVAALDDTKTVPVNTISMSSNDAQSMVVVRRQKAQQPLAEEERLGRRVSYLKATWGDRMHVDSDLDLSDSETPHIPHHSSVRKWRPPLFPDDVQELKRIFEDVASPAQSRHLAVCSSHYAALDQPIKLNGKENLVVIKEGSLHCKVTLIDGKRASDRSWKLVWAVLRGPILMLYKERRDFNQPTQTPIVQNEGEQQIDMRSSQIEIADDYTKRKHVLRVNTSTGSEVLLQADDADDMNQWLLSLSEHAQQPEETVGVDAKKHSLLQQTSPNARLSPLPGHKGIKKFTALRNRSPTGQAAITKTRKQSQSDQLPSPKHKTWKGRVARQFRRIQHGASSPNSPTAQHPDNVTFGIPLEECTPSSYSTFVPLLVELCASVVDTKGLDVVGIYRVPGNTAAVSALTDLLSKGFDEVALQDNRWQDVNVISSLLKLFFRRLPDALLTSELYSNFIEADKIEDSNKRMAAIKKLVHSLPDWHFETLKYLLFHLKRVVEHSERNKMEARNLAIVFGPTLVRTADGDMVTMVTDMSHQCRIVESLISHVEWFYADDDDAPESSFPAIPVQEPAEVEPSNTNHNLLLNNISKVQGIKTETPSRDINAKVLVSSIISAANRKIQKSKSRKSTTGSTSAADEAESGESAEEKKTGCDTKLKEPGESLSAVEDSAQQSHSSAVASSIIESVILSGDIVKHLQANEEDSEKTEAKDHCTDQPKKWSNESLAKTSSEDGTIRTYAGLSATTQERIRRFEQETKAMLQRDQTRHRHEQLEAEKLRIEHQLQQAKKDLETDDTLDKIADSISDVRKSRLKPSDEDVLHLQHLSLLDRRPAFDETSDPSSNPYHVATRSRIRQSSGLASYMAEGQCHPETVFPPHFTKVDDSSGCGVGAEVSRVTDLRCTSNKSSLKDHLEKKNSSVPLCVADEITKSSSESDQSKRQSHVDHEFEQIEVEEVVQSALHDSANISEEKGEESSKNNQWDSATALRFLYIHHFSPPDKFIPASSFMRRAQQHSLRGHPDLSSVFMWNNYRIRRPDKQATSPSFWCFLSHLHPQTTFSSSIIINNYNNSSTNNCSSSSCNIDSYSGSKNIGRVKFPTSEALGRLRRGSDLLASLTSTFDRKLKSLLYTSSTVPCSSASGKPLGDVMLQETADREDMQVLEPAINKSQVPSVGIPNKKGLSSTSALFRDPSLHRGRSLLLERQNGVELPLELGDSKGEELTNDRTQEDNKEWGDSHVTLADNDMNYDADVEGKESPCIKFKNIDTLAKINKTESIANSTKQKHSENTSKAEKEETTYNNSKLRRSESLTKAEKLPSSNTKLRRSESLTKTERADSPSNTKLKRSDSLTKTEKTESNNSKRKQDLLLSSGIRSSNRGYNKEKENMAINLTKLKRKNGMPERSIKRRHTVGGTKDFDKLNWLDNRLQQQQQDEMEAASAINKERQCLRTSSPDLSSSRFGGNMVRERFLVEIRMLGSGGIMAELRPHITSSTARPRSLPDPNLASRVFKVPLESHV
ncbi:rho GTPase-activating protein 21 [Anabrus simplex]|uniref:rho GTPase-activating protein 21 n=1 Tax=Anabrus simplex TaxID=316456 RepID=UPI0035A3BA1F